MGEDFMMVDEHGRHVHEDDMSWKAPIIHIDGPSGAPAQNYKDYKVLLLVVSANLHSVRLSHACLSLRLLECNCAISVQMLLVHDFPVRRMSARCTCTECLEALAACKARW